MKTICVYCGSSTDAGEIYFAAARELGTRIAQRGFKLVYGGAHVGLMGALADAALAHGGEVAGVIPRALILKEAAHRGLTEMHEVESMHDRKALMAGLSDAFIALPGGFGTLDELFEIVTWALLDFHAKPVVLVNVDGYFDHLLAFLERATGDGFIRPRHRALLRATVGIDEALALACESL